MISKSFSSFQYTWHLITLAMLGLAQPLFDLISQFPQFIVSQDLGGVELALLVLPISFLVPGSILLASWGLSRLGVQSSWLKSAGIGGLSFPLLMLLVKSVPGVPWMFVLGVAGTLALTLGFIYLRSSSTRLFLTFLTPAILLVPLLFWFRLSQTTQGMVAPCPETLEPGSTKVPLVLVIFDELPLDSLLDQSGNIDVRRFPGFADLASQATWFKEARTVSDSTQYAVPAILTGNYPSQDHSGKIATIQEYPQNLLTWLGDSHQIHSFEDGTRLFNGSGESQRNRLKVWVSSLQDLLIVYLHLLLPEDLSGRLPPIDKTWVNFQNQDQLPLQQFEAFLDSLEGSGRPGLHFIHSRLPHFPWTHLPSGKRYLQEEDHGLFLKNDVWTLEEDRIVVAYQRHLLQVGLVDRLLARLMDSLKAHGLFDSSLIVVVSDHGASFRPGESRRNLTESNADDILRIPLLIKFPFQEKGYISTQDVKTVDIVPTVAGVLETATPWKTDGIALVKGEDPVENQHSEQSIRSSSDFQMLQTSLCLDGLSHNATLEGAWAYLDVVRTSQDKVIFYGWAADKKNFSPAVEILIFIDGILEFRGTTGYPRNDVARRFEALELQNSGYLLEVESRLFSMESQVRVFALFPDLVNEMRYPLEFPWAKAHGSKTEVDGSRQPDCTLDVSHCACSYLISRVREPEMEKQSDFQKQLHELAWNSDEKGLFLFGPHDALLGKRVLQLDPVSKKGLQIKLHRSHLYENVRPGGVFIPAVIDGWVKSSEPIDFVAVAINGTIQSLDPIFSVKDERRRFQSIVPEDAFWKGRNLVEIFAVTESLKEPFLAMPEP